MFDTPVAAPPLDIDTRLSATFEVALSAEVEAPARIVRLATTTPFALVRMTLGPIGHGRRTVEMTVSATDGTHFQTLRKRLERVLEVLSVDVVT